jgi:UDP-N-acetylmuramoyl-tripeptide--D-alanyl-D-alanine ligase
VWDYRTILEATNGELIRLKSESFSGISTDSRTIRKGEIFIPLKGKRYDGHDFIKAAILNNGVGTLCDQEKIGRILDLETTIIAVNDTNRALAQIASFKRKRISSKFVAITGSCGKTTTKEALVQITRKEKSVVYNEKNYNNIFGVSRTIIGMENDPQVAIFELGTNSFGEIRDLTRIVEPDISAITNVKPAHLEGLKSISGVLNEKLDLFRYTKEGGTILINRDDESLRTFKDERKKILYFGIKNRADFSLQIERDCGWEGYEVVLNLGGKRLETKTKLLGFHNLYNILLAASIAALLGIDEEKIREGIEEFGSYPMRMNPKRSKRGYIILDDTYNSNPSSVEEAIKTFKELPCEGRKIVVLGDMNELGKYSSYYHRKLGMFLNSLDFEYVFLFGEKIRESYEEVKKGSIFYFDDRERLVEKLLSILRDRDCLLIKGSRSLNMDLIVEEII